MSINIISDVMMIKYENTVIDQNWNSQSSNIGREVSQMFLFYSQSARPLEHFSCKLPLLVWLNSIILWFMVRSSHSLDVVMLSLPFLTLPNTKLQTTVNVKYHQSPAFLVLLQTLYMYLKRVKGYQKTSSCINYTNRVILLGPWKCIKVKTKQKKTMELARSTY